MEAFEIDHLVDAHRETIARRKITSQNHRDLLRSKTVAWNNQARREAELRTMEREEKGRIAIQLRIERLGNLKKIGKTTWRGI